MKLTKQTKSFAANTAETAAIIAEGVYGNTTRYAVFYDRMSERLGGFPGVARLIARFSVALTAREETDAGLADNWVDITSLLSFYILRLQHVPEEGYIEELITRAAARFK